MRVGVGGEGGEEGRTGARTGTGTGREEGLWRETKSDTNFGRSVSVGSDASSALGRGLSLWKLRVVVIRIDETKTCKGTLGPAGSRNIPDMCGTGSKSECWVMKGVLEMGVVGCEREPGEKSTAAVGMSG